MVGVFIFLWKEGRLRHILTSVKGSIYIIAFCALGIMVPVFYGNWLGLAVGLAMCLIFIFALYARTVMTKPLLNRVIDISCVASVWCLGVAVVQQLIFTEPSYRACATFMNPNYYATMIEFVVLLAVYRLLGNLRWPNRLFYLGVIGANIVGLYLCDCRTAWFALFLGIPVLLLINKRYKALALQLIFTAAFLIALPWLPNLLPRLGSVGSSFDVRQSIWVTAIQGFLASPLFGEGGLTYQHIFRELGGYPTNHAHNLLLELLLNYGIAGVCLIAAYLMDNLKPLVRMLKQRSDPRLLSLIVATIVAVAAHGTMDATVFYIQTGMMLAVVLSCADVQGNPVAIQRRPLYGMEPNPLLHYYVE